jgi:hypothetical protein
MKRHIKKHLKALRRKEKNKYKDKFAKRNRYWYAIYCMGENLFIGVSYADVKTEGGRVKVNAQQWLDEVCAWRDPKYRINMLKFAVGDTVHCPHCGSKVDFRLWASATKPQFMEVKPDVPKENTTEKLPDTPQSGT